MSQPKLIGQARAVIRLKHYSDRTEEAYWHWIRTFILFHPKRHPNEMGETEISTFLSHLATNKKVSASTQNQSLSALLFSLKRRAEEAVGLDREHRTGKETITPSGCLHPR